MPIEITELRGFIRDTVLAAVNARNDLMSTKGPNGLAPIPIENIKISFSVDVAPVGGINAIERITRTVTPATTDDTTTTRTTTEPDQITTTEQIAEVATEESTKAAAGVKSGTSTQAEESNTDTDDKTTQLYGRETETVVSSD